MATHHPMDRLHEHLDKAAGHAAQVHAAASSAVAESSVAWPDEHQNDVNDGLTEDRR